MVRLRLRKMARAADNAAVMEDRVLSASDTDVQADERGRRFMPARLSADAEADRERDPLEDLELEPGWEPA